MKKGIWKISALVIIMSLAGVIMAGCQSSAGDTSNVTTEDYTYVRLSINPEVEFTVDSENIVATVNSLNSDAEVLLSDANLTGMSVEDATEEFVDLATEAGYIDVNSEENEVEITVIDEDTESQTAIKDGLTLKLNQYFNNNGIYGKVSEETLEEYATQAAGLGVSVGKMKMILRAIDLNPELTLEELAAMDVKEIITIINIILKEEDLGYTARLELKADKDALKLEYSAMFTLCDEIEALEIQLEAFTGTDEEKAVLEQTLAEKQAQYNILKAEYDIKKAALKSEAEALKEQVKAQNQLAKQERVEANAEKMEQWRKNKQK